MIYHKFSIKNLVTRKRYVMVYYIIFINYNYIHVLLDLHDQFYLLAYKSTLQYQCQGRNDAWRWISLTERKMHFLKPTTRGFTALFVIMFDNLILTILGLLNVCINTNRIHTFNKTIFIKIGLINWLSLFISSYYLQLIFLLNNFYTKQVL